MMLLAAGCGTTADEDVSLEEKCDEARSVEMITLRFAVAAEVCESLKSLLVDPPSPPIVADPRTNSIIVVGSIEEIVRVKEVIAVIDRKAPLTENPR